MNFRYIVYLIIFIILVLLVLWGGIATLIAIDINKNYLLLKNEKNLLQQNYEKIKTEYQEKTEILNKQNLLIEKIKKANNFKDYINIWKEINAFETNK